MLDLAIVGAGFAGLYMLHKARKLGLRARVFEAGSGVGGTWYWNRYPGARFDSESWTYGYSFSDEILREWEWSEHFAAQPETLANAFDRPFASSADLPDSFEGILFANELLDALPVHSVVMTEHGLREHYVDAPNGRLVERVGRPSSDALERYLAAAGVELRPGMRAEINLAALAWTGVRESGRGCSLSRLGYDALTRPKSFHLRIEL